MINDMKRRRRILIKYTVLFICYFFCAFGILLFSHKAFLWKTDGLTQNFPILLYTRAWLKTIITSLVQKHQLMIPQWELNLGLGFDVFGDGMGYRLLNFLYPIFPKSAIEYFLVFRTAGYLYLAGLSFLFFSCKRTNHESGLLIATFLYVFSGYSLFFAARHSFFIEMLIYFPLMLVGAQQVFDRRVSVLLVCTVFFCSVSYFYFLFLITVPTVIFVLYLFVTHLEPGNRKKSTARFFQLLSLYALHYVFGMMLSAFSLIPSLIRTFNSIRLSASDSSFSILWDFDYYLDMLEGLFGSREIGMYGFICCSVFVLYGVILSFVRKLYGEYIRHILIYFVVFQFPLFVMIFSGFSGKTQRWCFIFCFWTSVLVAVVYERILFPRIQEILLLITVAGIYVPAMLILSMLRGRKPSISLTGLMLGILVFVLFFMLDRLPGLDRKKCILYKEFLTFVYLGCFILLTSRELYASNEQNYVSEFVTAGSVYDSANTSALAGQSVDIDNRIFRVDVDGLDANDDGRLYNYGFRGNINGLSSYCSYLDKEVSKLSLDLGNAQQNTPILINGFDQRTILNTLMSVKYLSVQEGNESRLPAGYSYVGEKETEQKNGVVRKEKIYQNDYALPLIYTYDSYISEEMFDTLHFHEKEQAMLEGIVLAENPQVIDEVVPSWHGSILVDTSNIERIIKETCSPDELQMENGKITVFKKNVRLKIPVPERYVGKKRELAVIFENLSFDTYYEKDGKIQSLPGTAARISAKTKLSNDYGIVLGSKNQYYFGNRNLLINLGYGEIQKSITVTFSAPGTYSFDKLAVIQQQMKEYYREAEKRGQIVGQNITYDINSIDADIYTNQPVMACVSVPYSDGWTLYVNGEKREIVRGNKILMAFPVTEQENHIHLVYSSPGFDVGVTISLVSLVVFLGSIIVWKKIMNKKREECISIGKI